MKLLHTQLGRQSISTVVTLMLLVAALLTLVHWHQDSAGQRCEICFARHLPSLHVPFSGWIGAPARVAWHSPTEEATNVQTTCFQHTASRAPPRISSL